MKHFHCPVNGWDCPYFKNETIINGQKETAASHRMMYPMVLKNYIGGMAVVAMSGRPAQRQDQAARIARFAVTPESLRVSMTLRV